jgi:hypothetical protein
MRFRLLGPVALAMAWISSLAAQDLAPRAYLITPVNSNAVNLTYSFYSGGVDFNGSVPITNAQGTYSVPVFSLYHSFSFFGRSANITAGLPYDVGTFSGNAFGQQKSLYRSGLLDLSARLAVNLVGGPAMQAKDFAKWKQKVILGASLKIVAPSGQYDPTKLVNWGINRWAFKPEVGYSERWGNWILDAYGGVWFYTTNPAYYDIPRPSPQTEAPIGSFEGHLSYDLSRKKTTRKLKPWASLDGNFWWGGITALSGIQNVATKQTSSRIGGTFALPLGRRQSLKLSYSDGSYVRFGGNYQNVQVGWQYTWIGTHIR